MVFTPTSRAAIEEIDKAWRCKVTIRLASCVASVVAIGCIAWATDKGPHEAEYHVWDWQTVPWDFLSLVLCIIGNILALTLLTIDLRLFLRARNIALDLFLTIVLFVGCFLAIAGAIPSLNWNADDWYNNDDPSGLGYKIITPEGTQPWMPPHDDTPCSGFSSCAEQDAFTTKTHHRAMVELVGGVFTIVAVINHIILFIWACSRNRKCLGHKETTQEVAELQAGMRRT
ncbi:hypothetical protein MMC22_003624 [Lobaria immixta]|nr:hypothetical protein [Lobaria immixta]